MDQREPKKKKWGWLFWIAYILLLLVIGLGPLLMLISYTQDDQLSLGRIWERLRSGRPEAENEPARPANEEPLLLEPYMIQYLYRHCDHGAVYQPKEIPPELPEPPGSLVEIASALHQSNISLENLMDDLKVPGGWYLVDTKQSGIRPFFVLTHLADFCPQCDKLQYIGICGDRIAVYKGAPPHGKLIELTPYEVKEIHREELAAGVPFASEAEKIALLEGYTS